MTLNKRADLRFPTTWATFRLMAFEGVFAGADEKQPQSGLALILGNIHIAPPVVRIHSQCLTGDLFHSLRCDCHDQLHLALRTIAQEGAGVLLYEYQEGRGIGLVEKLRAYELQDEGLDTIEANLRLGHPVDLRDYRLPVEILRFLGVRSLRLMTNNPQKIEAIQSAGFRICRRLAADVAPTADSQRYLATKRDLLGHLYGGKSEQSPNHNGIDHTYGVAQAIPEYLSLGIDEG
jgi:GTP cyclohydrolase II